MFFAVAHLSGCLVVLALALIILSQILGPGSYASILLAYKIKLMDAISKLKAEMASTPIGHSSHSKSAARNAYDIAREIKMYVIGNNLNLSTNATVRAAAENLINKANDVLKAATTQMGTQTQDPSIDIEQLLNID